MNAIQSPRTIHRVISETPTFRWLTLSSLHGLVSCLLSMCAVLTVHMLPLDRKLDEPRDGVELKNNKIVPIRLSGKGRLLSPRVRKLGPRKNLFRSTTFLILLLLIN